MTHEHLSDEQLSAYLDDQPSAETPTTASDGAEEAMTSSCGRCRQRLAALTAARDLVRLPVTPVPPSVRAAAVEAAIADALGPESTDTVPPSVVTPFRRHRDRPTGVLVGAVAAVALLVVVGLSVALSHRSSSTATSAAAPTTARSTAHSPAAPSGGEKSLAPLGQPALDDLGSVTSPQTLKARLAPALATERPSADSAAPSATAGIPTTATGTGRDSGSTQSAASPPAGANAPAFSVEAVPPMFTACVSKAAEEAPGPAHTVELVATVTYGHTPALAVVLHPSGSSSEAKDQGDMVIVVAQSGCRVLARTTI